MWAAEREASVAFNGAESLHNVNCLKTAKEMHGDYSVTA